ncbi:OmpA family protein [Phaeobacter sp. 11ANDIMAR09]|uniref:OmpA family protein n=1 Tax=Phaeobacter sp. 11ANDIMAR09 TaxID=1225647 RepID=UPI0006C8C764|nr:OmpA family protein [Phaeobacter sp. 11ANDIMAR09]KPD11849.1 flagellar motor protein MotB [Phaeobacter sp. 11ANDIMAR09]
MVRDSIIAAFMCSALFLSTSQGHAQESGGGQSVEEITKILQQQKTRGLVIAPSSAATAPQASDSLETATVATANADYAPVDRQSQINLQISFDFDSATLRADQSPKLVNMCTSMQALQGTVFQIIGHTDSSGSASYNERLSLLRAQEVRRHLITTCGIPETMLKAIGMGEAAPYNAANPRADENRRVEFQALG